ncbi:weak toxin CM-13b-like [Sphaerodactylus townsendi]|uniref:weak toxin CM-13b-like n=1 Tax=Sphaerodactylus townsendi TaxID=933632 RepID=UPI002026BE1E|nr:weak toxin CM-13b-like [Sphaerodactylus townsendi]
MKSVILLFLVTAPWAKRANSLECFICNSTKYTGCDTVENCTAKERFCTRFTATTISGFLIMQSCATVCPIARRRWPPQYTFMCCQTDGCNHASGVTSYGTLLAIAAFASLVRALVALGL